jgi:hypothetical protein
VVLEGAVATEAVGVSSKTSLDVQWDRGSGAGGRAFSCGFESCAHFVAQAELNARLSTRYTASNSSWFGQLEAMAK